MARQLGKLKALGLCRKPRGRHADGGGLYLLVDKAGARRWIFRFRWKEDRATPGNGGLRDMGLGNLASVPLAKAREVAARCRSELAGGLNPIAEKARRHRSQSGIPTFGRCADELVDQLEKGWRNEKHRYQWRQTVTHYAGPIRSRPVDKITTEDVLSVLQPLWHSKPATAARLRGRIEAVLDAARAKGHIAQGTANPARWRGHLDKLLAKQKKLSRGHLAAMPFAEVPAFLDRLRARKAIAALALEFTILTVARSGETRNARWSEIDRTAKVWTVPADRMKAGRPHRVPLVPRAMEIFEEARKLARGELIFPAHRADKPLSDMAFTMLLRRMQVEGATAHGFRSSFRDWAGELTGFSREVAEAALAHAVGDDTELAYRRGDALLKRRKLMEDWANYLDKAPGANVLKPDFGGAKA